VVSATLARTPILGRHTKRCDVLVELVIDLKQEPIDVWAGKHVKPVNVKASSCIVLSGLVRV